MGQVLKFPENSPTVPEEKTTYPIPVPQDILDEFFLTLEEFTEDIDQLNDIANHSTDLIARGEAAYKLGCLSIENYHGWFENSANAGYAQGQYALARLMEVGAYDQDLCITRADKPDLMAAAYWYYKAEKQGHSKSFGRAERLFSIVKEQAVSGDPDAMFDIGACHETGLFEYASKDIGMALSWYEKASQKGNAVAHLSLGEIYFHGDYGINRDIPRSFENFDCWREILGSVCNTDSLTLLRSINSFANHVNLFCRRSPIGNLALLYFENHVNERLDRIIDSHISKHEAKDLAWDLQLLCALRSYLSNGDLIETRKNLLTIICSSEVSDISEGDDYEDDYDLALTLNDREREWGDPFGSFEDRKPVDPSQIRCRRMEAVLREIAEKDVPEAGMLLGLILVGSSSPFSPDAAEGKAWIEVGVKKNDLLSCLWYSSLARRGLILGGVHEIKASLKRVIYADWDEASGLKSRSELKPRKYHEGEEIFNENFFQALRQRATHQLAEIERDEAVKHAKEQAQRDMLSYLTHTLNNTLSSGPEAARQAMRILGSDLYENNREYKAINNIAAMFSTFLFAQQLLKTFKLYIAEPELLRQNWEGDVQGDSSITVVLALSLRQTLSQLVFSANHQAALQRLLPHKEAGSVKDIRKSFMEEVVPLDVDADNAATLFGWVRTHLGVLKLHIGEDAELNFRSNSTRFTFFFSSFSELIYNALKYSDGVQPIELFWGKEEDSFNFRCRNTWSEESLQSSEGSGKGLVFLTRLVEMLGASLSTRSEGGVFEAEIRFPEKLILGGA